MATCDMIIMIDDSEFGFWDSVRMGEVPIHQEACGDPAVMKVTDARDGSVYHFCVDCAKRGTDHHLSVDELI